MKIESLILLSLIVLSSCQETAPSVSTPSEQEQQALAKVGAELSRQLMDELKSSLLRAVNEGGPVHAVRFCNLQALPLTQGVARPNPGVRLKRTSLKIRNPKNAPDEFELQALRFFQGPADSGEALPASHQQKITKDGTTFFRYYSPITTNEFCLNCHGVVGGMDPDLATTLREMYPEDQAVNYRAGEFRGLITVEVNSLSM